MNAAVFAIRPEPGLSTTMAAGRELGLEMHGEPLFEICSETWEMPDPDMIDALLIGSANAIRHGGPGLDLLRGKPVHAVGQATARLARDAGFSVERIGEGGLQSLLRAPTGPGTATLRYLRLSGAERVMLDIPRGVHIDERIVYRAAPSAMSAGFADRLRSGGIVLLHSAAAARHFALECSRLGIPIHALAIAAIGPRVTAGMTGDWGAICHPASPDDCALLAMAKDMCQDHRNKRSWP